MSKAILVLDEMPLNCDKCPCQYDDGYCTIERSETHQAFWQYKRPDWCPLEELPEPLEPSSEDTKALLGQNPEMVGKRMINKIDRQIYRIEEEKENDKRGKSQKDC